LRSDCQADSPSLRGGRSTYGVTRYDRKDTLGISTDGLARKAATPLDSLYDGLIRIAIPSVELGDAFQPSLDLIRTAKESLHSLAERSEWRMSCADRDRVVPINRQTHGAITAVLDHLTDKSAHGGTLDSRPPRSLLLSVRSEHDTPAQLLERIINRWSQGGYLDTLGTLVQRFSQASDDDGAQTTDSDRGASPSTQTTDSPYDSGDDLATNEIGNL